MKSILLFVTLLIGVSNALSAQKITGQILDDKAKPAEFVSVMLLQAKDSTLVKGGITDMEGKFELENVERGHYFVRASLVGFKNVESPVFEYAGNDLIINSLSMSVLNTELKEVTITTSKPMIEVKPDKMIFNVEASVSAVGNNGLELLRKAPGVTVDKDENVLLKGKSAVKVYIDGKPSQLGGKDLAALLKSLNSSDVEAIELISNPGARYDASGNAGIINIRLKKNKKLGSSGNLSLGTIFAITPKYDGSISLNYREKKINFFSNYSVHRGRWHNDLNLYTKRDGLYFDQNTPHYNDRFNHNIKIGTDVYLNDKHTIGTIITGNFSNNKSHSSSRTLISQDVPRRLDSILIAASDINGQNRNLNYNLNYRFTDTLGHELSMDADYGTFTSDNSTFQPNYYKNPTETVLNSSAIYRNNMPTDILIQTFKTDYEQRLGKGKLGMGAKVSKVVSDNTFNFYDVKDNLNLLNIDRSNTFKYNELVNAAYLNYNQTFGKMGLQLGLRGERTHAKGDLKSFKPQNAGEKVDTTYINFFPNIGLSWQLNKKNAFNLTYRRSIERPNYQDLNPFENKIDELTFQKGNPFLRPQFSNTIELGHSFMEFLNSSINYTHTDDFFVELIDSRKDPITNKVSMYQTKENLAKVDNYSFNTNIPMPLAKWWMGSLNFWVNRSQYRANFGSDKIVNLQATAYGFWSEQTITLGHGFKYEISGWYNSPSVWGTFRSDKQWMMDMGLQKTFWNKNATLKLSFSDLFRTAKWSGITDFGKISMRATGNWEGRQFKINFNYRFGNKEVKGSDRKAGSETESSRIKSGK
jgi:iron complex outermembrane recepter protein